MRGGSWAMVGAVSGGLAVAAGAFGAHGLEGMVADGRLEPRLLEVYRTAATYQMYHALALVAVGLLAGRETTRAVQVAGWAFLIGTIGFSGSLYALVATGIGPFGAITPVGGVALIVGWAALAVAARGRSGG